MTPPEDPRAPDQRAVDQSPENLPAPPGQVDARGARTGMFGAKGTGDTSGYGGLVAPVVFPEPTGRPFGGWFDEVADALLDRLQQADGGARPHAIAGVVVHRGEITFHVRREDLPPPPDLRRSRAPAFPQHPGAVNALVSGLPAARVPTAPPT